MGCTREYENSSFGPIEQFEKYLGMRVAAIEVDHYQPRDELTFISHHRTEVDRFRAFSKRR